MTYGKHRFHIIVREVDVEDQGMLVAETCTDTVSGFVTLR